MLLQTNDKLKKDKLHLTNPVFSSLQDSSILLSDEVIVFHDGQSNVIITKKTFNKYPVIYSKYYYEQENLTEDITISLCPYSQASTIYYGKYRMTGEIYNNNIILENIETNEKIHQINGVLLKTTLHKASVLAFNKIDNSNIKQRTFSSPEPLVYPIITESETITNLLKCSSTESQLTTLSDQTNLSGLNYIKKISTKQMIVRNAISTFIDCKYLDDGSKTDNVNKIFKLPKDYELSDVLAFSQSITKFKYFPKMLVYGIEYISRKIGLTDIDPERSACAQIKHTVIISKYASKYITKHPTKKDNHDYIKNGYKEYFIKTADKLKNKGAVIIPCYYFTWLTFYPNSKIVQLF